MAAGGPHALCAAAMDFHGNKSTPISASFQMDAILPVFGTCPEVGPFLAYHFSDSYSRRMPTIFSSEKRSCFITQRQMAATLIAKCSRIHMYPCYLLTFFQTSAILSPGRIYHIAPS